MSPYLNAKAPGSKTIFVQIKNLDLLDSILDLSVKLGCEVYLGENSSGDIMGIPYFIAIVEQSELGEKMWKHFLKYRESSEEATMIIITDLDQHKDLCLSQNMMCTNEKEAILSQIANEHHRIDQ